LIILPDLAPQYRVTMDESYKHERPEIRREDRRWYERIPCRGGGFIALFSENPPILMLWTPQIKSARAIAKKVTAVPGLENEWLDDEAVIYFHLDFLGLVAKMAGALRKRQGRKLSAVEQTKLIEAGKAHRFKGKSTGRQVENLAQI
jgi:hypothetical protein